MKKILLLVLCILISALALVSCGDDEIGSYKENYPPINNEVEEIKLNMYIIVDDAADNAKKTVKRMFAQETLSSFHTEVNLVFVTAEEYASTVLGAVNEKDASKAANIVLVNSEALMNSLVKTNKILALNDYLESSKFGKLNAQISETLMKAATNKDGVLYAIPNNHVIGQYKYLVINKEAARACFFDIADVALLDSYEDTATLREEMLQAGYTADEISSLVREVYGPYEKKAEIESAGNFCNVIEYPIATSQEAFSSAFAIVDSGDATANERAMQIIYAINSDADFRNLLQYGVSGTNYTLASDGTVDRVDSGDNKYHMNLLYTGDIFKALYCKDIGWTAQSAANGEEQNKQSLFVGQSK